MNKTSSPHIETFSMRIDKATMEYLDLLAERTRRSRGSVIRWLIYKAALELENPESVLLLKGELPNTANTTDLSSNR